MHKRGRSLSYANVMATVAMFGPRWRRVRCDDRVDEGRDDPRLRVCAHPRADGAQALLLVRARARGVDV